MPATAPRAPRPLSTFQGIDEDVATFCLGQAAISTAKRGELLIQQGEKARLLYVVRSGYAKLVSMSPDGHEVMVGIVGPRDIFGQAAVMDEERGYLVTATALTGMDMAIWSRAKAIELSKQFPEIHARLDAQLAPLAKLHGKATIARWMEWARAGATTELAADLLDMHYDPSYTRAIRRNFPLLRHAEVLRVHDAADATFRGLARRLLHDDSPKTAAA